MPGVDEVALGVSVAGKIFGGKSGKKAAKKAARRAEAAARKQREDLIRVAKITGDEIVNTSRDFANLTRANALVARGNVAVQAAAAGAKVGSGSVQAVQDDIIAKASADALVALTTAKREKKNRILNAQVGGDAIVTNAQLQGKIAKANANTNMMNSFISAANTAVSSGLFDTKLGGSGGVASSGPNLPQVPSLKTTPSGGLLS